MTVRSLTVPAPFSLTAAVCADFHAAARRAAPDEALALLEEGRPDLILCPGDIFQITVPSGGPSAPYNKKGRAFLARAAEIAPTYWSAGNHEHAVTEEHYAEIAALGAVCLRDSWTRHGDLPLLVGGYASGFCRDYEGSRLPDADFPARFAAEDGYKLLLCHHPEYWEPHIRGRGIDLTVSGHAHGGQWRFFGRGVYAPGQGLFPRCTSGLYAYEGPAGREYLAVSRGMTNSQAPIPRLFNPCEILFLRLTPEAAP